MMPPPQTPPVTGGQPDLQRLALLQMLHGQSVQPPPPDSLQAGAPAMPDTGLLPPGFSKPKPFMLPRMDDRLRGTL